MRHVACVRRYVQLKQAWLAREGVHHTAVLLFAEGPATVAAAEEHSVAWFKKPTPNAAHNSSIKQQNGDRPDCLKLKVQPDGKRATEVQVASWRNGKLTKPMPGTLDDITPGSSCLVIARVQGGVYFVSKSYGTSLVAAKVLVIKPEGGPSGTLEFDFGDVEMTDVELEEEED